MAHYTTNFNLYEKDPAVDGTDLYSITTMMNENWDKLDMHAQKKLSTGAYIQIENDVISAVGVVPSTRTVNGQPLSADVQIDALPSQTGQSGKFLTTDGTNASWGTIASSANPSLGNLDSYGEAHFANPTLSNVTSFASVVNALYPVGSIYMGITSTCPLAAIVGTWTKIEGRYLLASGTITGTSETVTAGNTVGAGLPNISGYIEISKHGGTNTWWNWSGAFYSSNNGLQERGYGQLANENDSWNSALDFSASRSNSIYGSSATVRPPAYAVNVWRRTA